MTPENKKYLNYALVAFVVVGGYYALFAPASETSTGGGTDPTGNGGNNNPGDLNQFNALNVATSLYNAMKDSGTDEKSIINILTYVTQNQFPAVVKAFGALPYNKTFGNQVRYIPGVDLPRLTLKEWLFEELNDANYRILKLKYPNFL